ncbi:hypothetical protein [Streptomyces sp. NBC_00287]|uniref:hypothetical protein n=1 Tax=Streptomyces sp. NBC_00287 TaxID=2975702 RepID=UPI002E2D8E99|nr:hypothetical protein [Streptomyces sp. NBC_00287]
MSTQIHRLTITEPASSDDSAVLRVSGELDQTCESYSSCARSEPVSALVTATWCWT